MQRKAVAKTKESPTHGSHVQSQSARSASAAHPMLTLQRSIGNAATQRLIRSAYIQTKLQVSTPDDPLEQEADHTAETVMRMPEPNVATQVARKPLSTQITRLAQRDTDEADEEEKVVAATSKSHVPLAAGEDDEEGEEVPVHRACAECEEELVAHRLADEPEDEEVINRKDGRATKSGGTQHTFAARPAVSNAAARNIHALNGGGSPLPAASRAFFEPRFGADLSHVRVHTDYHATESAKSINARAFTVGPNIAFAPGQYSPDSEGGRQLLAHELTHVIQQSHKLSPMVQRWGELEHKTVGNEAQNEFPYRGKIQVDLSALRETPRKPARDPYGNIKLDLFTGAKILVVGKERGWLQVVVESGVARDKKGATVVADTATGYVSKELITKSPDIFDADLPIAGGLNLSYGDLVAMGGDHFKDLAQLMGEASAGPGRSNLKKLRDTIDNEKTKSADYSDPATISQDYADRFKKLAVDNVSHFSHGGTSSITWHNLHIDAVREAFEAGRKGQTSGLAKAYVINGFADHFLTDSFSGGHVRVPRQQIIDYYKKLVKDLFQQIIDNISNRLGARIYELLEEDYRRVRWFGGAGGRRRAVNLVRQRIMAELPKVGGAAKVEADVGTYLAGAISKILHDTDNQNGLSVVSKKHPEGWTAMGDGLLEVPANAKNLAYMKEAVQASKQDLVDAFRIGLALWSRHRATPPQDEVSKAMVEVWMKVGPPYKAWDFVPSPAPSATPMAGWEWGKLDQNTRARIAALVGKYLTADVQKMILDLFPVTEEVEVEDAPDVDARPRDAASDILNEMLRDPVAFLEMAFGKKASP